MKVSMDTDVIEGVGYREKAVACAITRARAHVQAPGATEIAVAPGPANNSSLVTVTVRWRLPGETKGGYDGVGGSQYETSAVIGSN